MGAHDESGRDVCYVLDNDGIMTYELNRKYKERVALKESSWDGVS